MKVRRLLLVLLALLVLFLVPYLLAPSRSRGGSLAPPPEQSRPAGASREDARLGELPARQVIEEPADERAAEAAAPLATEPASPDALPPGSIEGLVLRAGRPVGGGEAWAERSSFAGDYLCEQPAPEVGRVPIGADGTFRFVALTPGDYCLGAHVEPGVLRTRRFHLTAEAGQRWLIQLGTAEIHGHVWDPNGAPADGVRVSFSRVGEDQREPDAFGETLSGLDGAYRLTSLEAGRFGLQASFAPGDPRNRFVFALSLAADEVKEVDFGSPLGLGTWTGRLEGAAGAALAGISMQLTVEDRDTGVTRMVRTQGDGLFSTELPPGTYSARLGLLYEERPLGEFEMGAGNQETVFRLEGAAVRVDVRYVGTKRDRRSALAQILVQLRPEGSTGKPVTAQPGYDGSWHFVGVTPGRYEVWPASAAPARRPPETFPLLVAPGDSELSLEITVGDP